MRAIAKMRHNFFCRKVDIRRRMELGDFDVLFRPGVVIVNIVRFNIYAPTRKEQENVEKIAHTYAMLFVILRPFVRHDDSFGAHRVAVVNIRDCTSPDITRDRINVALG